MNTGYKTLLSPGIRVDILISPQLEDEMDELARNKDLTKNQLIDSFVHSYVSKIGLDKIQKKQHVAKYKLVSSDINIINIVVKNIVYIFLVSDYDMHTITSSHGNDTIRLGWASLYRDENKIVYMP